jgi:PAS domain S-box-containing protein
MDDQVKSRDELLKELNALQQEHNALKALYNKDISESKRVENVLRKSEMQFRILSEQSPIAIEVLDSEGILISVNQACLDLFGIIDSTEIMRFNLFDDPNLTEERKKDLRNYKTIHYQSIFDFEKVKEFNLYQTTKSGQIWLDILVTSIKNDGNIPDGYYLHIQDITRQKLAEKALFESEKKFRNLFENATVGNSISNQNGIIIVNQAFCDIIGYSKSELQQIKWQTITHPDDIIKSENVIHRILNGEMSSCRWEKRYIHKNGNIVWVATSTVLERDDDGNPLYFITNTIDITDRKQMELALKQSIEKFSKIFSSNPSSISIKEFFGQQRFIDCNDAFMQFTGYKREEVIGATRDDINLFVDKEERIKVIETLNTLGKVRNFEHRYHKKNGNIGVGLLSAELIELNGKPHVIYVNQDISQRRLAEKALEESEKKFRDIFENSPFGIFQATLEGKLLKVNQAMVKILGYSSAEELINGITDLSVQVYLNSEMRQNIINALFENDDFYKAEAIWRKKDGSHITVDITGRKVKTVEGQVVYLEAFVEDVTGQRLAEKEIKTLSKAVEQSPSVIIITNSLGEIEFVNSRFVSFLQFTFDEIKGDIPQIFKPGCLQPDVYETMWETLRAGKIWHGELINQKKDRTNFWENIFIYPLLDDNGVLTNYILIIDDFTEKKHILDELIIEKEKAEESDRLKAAFLQNISHEIRTPMNAIIGFSGFLNDPDLSSDERKEYTGIIVDHCNQLLSIITDIINIATIETGQEAVDENLADINSLCKSIHDQFYLKAREHDIDFHYQISLNDNEAIILTDEVKLKLVLANLINNAFKFTMKGSVDFGYAIKDNRLEFWVKDTGIGIAPDKQEVIFKRFHQVDNNSTRQFGGSGLGLSIAKAYVEMMGGTIRVDSELGKGSTFLFTIPYKR